MHQKCCHILECSMLHIHSHDNIKSQTELQCAPECCVRPQVCTQVQIRGLTVCVMTSAGLAEITHVSNEHIACVFYILKGKAVPLQVWSGPEGSRKLRFPHYMTTAQDGGKVVSLAHRPPLPPGNAPGTHLC